MPDKIKMRNIKNSKRVAILIHVCIFSCNIVIKIDPFS